MLNDFNQEDYVKACEELEMLEAQIDEIRLQEARIRGDRLFLETQISELNSQVNSVQTVQDNINGMNFLRRLFHRKEIQQNMELIQQKQKELDELIIQLKELEEADHESSTLLEEKNKRKKQVQVPQYVTHFEGGMVINDNGAEIEKIESSIQQEKEEKVIVHCTSLFPKDHTILSSYEGGKVLEAEKGYMGVEKHVIALHARDEVHLTINARVKNTASGEGNWDNTKYMIVDLYGPHKDEIEFFNPSDSWTKGTSIKLSDSAVILVDINCRNEIPIPQEKLEEYNIVYYSGNPILCLQNFLRLNQYNIFKTDPNCAIHEYSLRVKQEKACTRRNLAINYMYDNKYSSDDFPTFSMEEVAQIYDIMTSFNSSRLSGNTKNAKEQLISFEQLVMRSGLQKTRDGRFEFKSNEEIFGEIKANENVAFEDKNEEYKQMVLELMEAIYKLQREQESKQLPSVESFMNMTVEELFKFKNMDYARAFLETIDPNQISVEKKREGVKCKIEIIGEEFKGKVEKKDDIVIDDYNTYQIAKGIVAQNDSTVAQIYEGIESFKEKLENIRNRCINDVEK